MTFEIVLFAGAVIAGTVAAVTRSGIDTVLTPLLATVVATPLAVAAISIPHFFATLLRFWRLRSRVDRRLLLKFVIPTAAGGLAGILLHDLFANRGLAVAFGIVLIFVGAVELSGVSRGMRFNDSGTWIAGALSGFFGGLARHQGGIRSAALLGFDISKDTFLATAAASWLVVDAVRMPTYLVTQGAQITGIRRFVALATIGALRSTTLGEKLLPHIHQPLCRRIVAAFVVALSLYMCIFVKL
ncbi:MAG: TSUP family transporter [Gemmatimonadaceae bacterium]